MIQLNAGLSSPDSLDVSALTQINRQLRELREGVRLKKEAYLRARQENRPIAVDLDHEIGKITEVLTVLDQIIEKFRKSNFQATDPKTIVELSGVNLLKGDLEAEKRKLEGTWLRDQRAATPLPKVRPKRKRRLVRSQIQTPQQNLMPESSELIKKFIETISHEPPKLELRGIRMELRSLVHRLTEQQEMLVSIRQEFDREKRRQASLKYQPPINPKPRLSRTLLKMRDELQSELRQVHNLKNSLERIISESKREHAKFIREKKNFMMDQENVKRRLTDLVEKNPEAATKSRAFSPVLTFKLNSDLYCIDANLVLEIIRGQMISITAQPGFVEGMLNYHGTPIPVLSLKARLGLGDSTKHAFTMIVHSDYGPVGLAIDEACQVLNLSTDEITRSPVSLDRRRAPASEYVRGVWHLGSKQLTCLNVEEILNTIQLRRITAQIQKSIKHQALGVHVRG